mgnify:CR=1 FL=1
MAESIINSKQSLDAYIAHLEAQFEKHKYLRVNLKTGRQRTLTQNRSLHLYCDHLANALNDAGLDFRQALRQDIEVPWDEILAKKYLWGPVQKAITGFDSSTKPETHQYGQIYEVLNRHISTKFGVYVPWPSKETMNNG